MSRPPYVEALWGLSKRGEFDELVRRCKEIIDKLSKSPTDEYPETALMAEGLAHAFYDMGDYCGAALEFERALQIHRAHVSVPCDDFVRCLMYLGRNYLWTGRPWEAEQALAEALTLLDHLPVEEQIGRGFVLVDLAQMHQWEGEFFTAERLLLQAIKPMLDYCGYGSEHLAFVYCHLARVYEHQGRTRAADRAMEKSIRWLRYAIPEDDSGLAAALSSNGLRLQRRGQLDEARAFQNESLSMLQRIRKPGHPQLDRVKQRLAKLDKAPVSSCG